MSKTPTYQETVRMFMATDRLHRMLVETRMTKIKLHRSQHMMLSSVACFPEPPTQNDLAEKLGISAATAAVTLKKLEGAGFVKREYSAIDNRCKHIMLTEKGKAILEKAQDIFDEVDKNMFSGLSEKELIDFIKTLEKVQANLTALDADADR